jgi:hypothetical protein
VGDVRTQTLKRRKKEKSRERLTGSATNTGSSEGSLGLEERRVLRVGVLSSSGGSGSSLGESLSGSGATGDTGGRVHVAGDDTWRDAQQGNKVSVRGPYRAGRARLRIDRREGRENDERRVVR